MLSLPWVRCRPVCEELSTACCSRNLLLLTSQAGSSPNKFDVAPGPLRTSRPIRADPV